MNYKGWEIKKISDLGEVISGGTPSTKIQEYWDGDISWITPKDLSGHKSVYISKGERNITKKGLLNSSARLMPKGSILFSSRAPIGYVAIASNELSTNQGFKSIIPNQFNSSIFIYYLLKFKTEEIKNLSGGSTFSEISGTAFKNINLFIPTLEKQLIIANQLETLDKKIELNNKINENLEELAQTLYKRWFVDFEFPNEEGLPYQSSGGEMVESELGLIPTGWRVLPLSDRFSFLRGVEPGSKNYIEKQEIGTIPFFRVGDLDLKSPVYVEESLTKNKRVNPKDILVSFDGAIGRIGFGLTGSYSTGIRKISDIENKLKSGTIYSIMKSDIIQNKIKEHANGTTILHAGSSIEFLKIPFEESVFIGFGNLIEPIFEQMLLIKKENDNLIKLRDILLPKLMNGEIDVPAGEDNGA